MADQNVVHEMLETVADEVKVSPITSTAKILVPYNANRVALVIGAITGDSLWLGMTSGVDVDKGIMIPMSTAPLKLTLTEHGRLVHGPIYALASSGNNTVTYWETHLACKCAPGY